MKYRGKIFNPNVFEKYLKTLESTKENSLINNALFTVVNKYKAKMVGQAGGYFITEPIKGRIGGESVNYDGETDIPVGNERTTYKQTKVSIGRAASWGENDFTVDITGENFMAEAGEIKEYWDEEKQKITLAILNGIFGIQGNNNFAAKHTYQVDGNLGADDCNRAAQKALGDKKSKLEVMYMHSAVSTNLEGLNLIEFLKYTDAAGITRELTIGTYNGKLVIVDDDMPVNEVAATYAASTDTEVVSSKTYYTRSGSAGNYTYSKVAAPTGNPSTSSYYEMTAEAYLEYTTYMFKNGFFEYEDLGVEVPHEVVRNATKDGGRNDLISRQRFIIVPTYISYTKTDSLSPVNADLANGANWELAKSENDGTTTYVDDKLIPVVRIISRG